MTNKKILAVFFAIVLFLSMAWLCCAVFLRYQTQKKRSPFLKVNTFWATKTINEMSLKKKLPN